MRSGIVKWFNPTKGFGFITDTEDNADIFVHHTAIQADGYRSLNEGDEVTFDREQTSKGWQATNVTVTKATEKTARATGR